MQVVLTSPYYARFDATGNDIRLTKKALVSKGIPTSIYAPMTDKGLEDQVVSDNEFLEIITSQDAIWIYHHGVYWPDANKWLERAKCKVLMRYHNVTPSEFFHGYDAIGEGATRMGREQTVDLVQSRKMSHFIPASRFNANELIEIGVSKDDISVIAPFNTNEEFDQCVINQQLFDDMKGSGLTNILMVGRIAPNKGHRHLIETLLAFFEMYGPAAKLHLAGTITPNFESYVEDLATLIDRYELGAYVNFTHKLPFNDLYTYYKASDVFLCLSEHEGFCLPIIEAQHLGLPVLTVNRCAMGDTVGKNQLVWDYYDTEFFAKAINALDKDKLRKKQIITAGHENVKMYSFENISNKYSDLLDYISTMSSD